MDSFCFLPCSVNNVFWIWPNKKQLYSIYFSYNQIIGSIRSSHPGVFSKTGALKTFTKFSRKYLLCRVGFTKVLGLRKKGFHSKVFLCEFCKSSQKCFATECIRATVFKVEKKYHSVEKNKIPLFGGTKFCTERIWDMYWTRRHTKVLRMLSLVHAQTCLQENVQTRRFLSFT